jgi:antitoxin ParD1/3/4
VSVQLQAMQRPMLTTVDIPRQTALVSRYTMSFALPESMREYIDARVRDGSYGNTSEYLRELIRRDQEQQAAARLRGLIADGLASGDGRPVTADLIAELRARSFGE